MVKLSVKTRKDAKQKENNFLPAVLYGPKLKNLNLNVDPKAFSKAYKEAGESVLISLKVEGEKDEFLVLIHDIQLDPLSGRPIHIDFYQPNLKEEVEITVPLIIEGESPAVKSLGGTLMKNISEIEVKALPQNLPKEIRVDVSNLANLEDNILVKDLNIPENVEILKEPDEIVITVAAPENVEEELEKPVEEGKEPELIKKEKEEKGEAEEAPAKTPAAEEKKE